MIARFVQDGQGNLIFLGIEELYVDVGISQPCNNNIQYASAISSELFGISAYNA